MRTFWETLLFQMHYTAKLLPPAISEKFKIFFRKTHIFPKQLKLFDVFENSDKSSCILQSCILQQTCHHQWILKNSNFFQDEPFFGKNPVFERFEKSHYFIRIRHQIGYLQLVSENSSFFFKKTICFFWITQISNFLRNEKSYCISCILHQIWYHQHFWKIQSFFRKTHIFLQKNQFLIVLRNLTGSFPFDIKLVNCSCFQKIEVFFKKSICFLVFQKWTFRETLILQSIPWQACYFNPSNKKGHDFFLKKSTYFFKCYR